MRSHQAVNNNEFTDLCSRHLYAVSHKATGVKPAAVARVQRNETVLLGRQLRDDPAHAPRRHQGPGTVRKEHEGVPEPRRKSQC